MPSPERDPRTDPRPGDVLTDGYEQTWEVEEVRDGIVTYATRNRTRCTVQQWAWRRSDARVVARGAERSGGA